MKIVKEKFFATMAALVAIVMVFASACSISDDKDDEKSNNSTNVSENYDETLKLLSAMSFSDVVDGVSELTYADEYLQKNGYESLVSDYVGFRDAGDLEGVNSTLYQLGLIILKGSVLDTIIQNDERFAQKLDVDFSLDDIDITIGQATEDFYGATITVNAGDEYAEFVPGGKFDYTFILPYDIVDRIIKCQEGQVEDLNEAAEILTNYKYFMVNSGSFKGDGSVMDAVGYGNSELNILGPSIDFSFDGNKVKALK